MDQGNHDVSNVQYYLRGVDFPAEKEDVAPTAPKRLCKRSKAASTLGE